MKTMDFSLFIGLLFSVFQLPRADAAPRPNDDTVICSILRCKGIAARKECRPDPAATAIVSMKLLAEGHRGLDKCLKGITYGPTAEGSVWVDGGCDGHFQVCYVTTQTELGCESGCGENTECREGQCHCRRGYYGNPYGKCEEVCTCSAYGDPHYRTYDKQSFTFNGACRYTLTEYTGRDDNCHFTVEVKNTRRGNRKRVSFTRSVYVKIHGLVIKLAKDKQVFVNGVAKYLPLKLDDHDIAIYNTGEYSRLVTGCGLSVSWNGRAEAFVTVPKKYGNDLQGLCGNCNGIKDDFKTKDGEDVSNQKKKAVLIGQSFIVHEENEGEEECETLDVCDPCSGDMQEYVEDLSYCGMLLNSKKSLSPFKECINMIPDVAKDMYESCRYDVCSYFHDRHRVKTIVCQALDALATECEERGYTVTWKSGDFCPEECPDKMVYSSDVSGCPATCIDPNPDPSKCSQPSTSGCTCLPGHLLSGNDCVKYEECGCKSEMGYIPRDKSYISTDCRMMLNCTTENGKWKLDKTHIELNCHEHAGCGLLEGVPSCTCNDGYFGDGVTRCDPLCNGKRCGIEAICSNERCICTASHHGNPYVKCEPKGVCDGERCAIDAECINYNCVCTKGFIGDGYSSCKRLCGRRRCANNAECINDECVCEQGYHGLPYSKCEPSEMCNGQTCAKNAKCVNFQCLCQIGFYGNGSRECKELCGGKRCADNARCEEGVCICHTDYHGNGYFRCEKKGICDGEHCAKGATCVNSECMCPEGYYGDPYTLCKPLCSSKRCAGNAECIRDKCVCLDGFHGDGAVKCEPIHLCDGKSCGINAVCYNYRCVCTRGYSGDPYSKCKPLCNGRKCMDNAYCYKDVCYCKEGYHGNGFIKCEPKALCGGRTCTASAKCVNYQCMCKDGYVGDGYHHCDELCGNRRCREYASCVDGKCQCIQGFQGNGYIKCEPVEFCDGRRCALQANCQYYQCVCDSDYYGDGYKKCERLCNGQRCRKDAECQNGKCVCREGFHGDANIACEPYSSCGGKQCTENAVCVNYQCQCTDGYFGNGYSSCKKLCGEDFCVSNAECKEDECECNVGYHGNGRVLCEPIGVCGGRTCIMNAHCYNYNCVCDDGYVGDGNTKCDPYCDDQKCAEYAYCEANECVCQNGYKGNPYLKCEPTSVCDGKECGAYSECVNYECKCIPGYIKKDTDDCRELCGGQLCVDNAVCNVNGHCECISGYHGNPLLKCEPSSVCGGETCSEYAECINYQCKCRSGFYDDGYGKCIRLCDGQQCKPHSRCMAGKCICDEGYHGDGHIKCEESGKCGGKTCTNGATCHQFHCICNLGFYGNGYDQCLPYCKGRRCVKHAVCRSTGCVCEEGYHGNGLIKCEANGVCNGIRCAEHAECLNYKCMCRDGYTGDGYKHCKELCNGRKCSANSKCDDGKCVCDYGYHGNGYVLCEPLTECGGKECAPFAECINFHCQCITGYKGDGYKNCQALCNNRECVEYATCHDDECICNAGYHGDGYNKCEVDGFCDGKKCHNNAQCVNFKCVCMEGYAGDGETECDELCGGQNCGDHAFCEDGKCVCDWGYHGDPEIGCEREGICGSKKCAENTKCINRRCVCAEGYIGDGYEGCEELCGGRSCGTNAYCDNDVCKCQQGYHGNALLECEPVGYCAGSACADNAECVGYCKCKEGYQGDGITKCEASCGGRTCAVNAVCESDTCECQKGYHGNGNYKCEPEGQCDGKICNKNAMCMNFMCLCKKGFFGDGIERCDEFCSGRLCVQNAKCVDGECVCKEGFRGNGNYKCEPDGMCGGKSCAAHAECYQYKCRCRKGYYGDGFQNCEAEGYCRGKVCADNAICDDGRCVCKGGYVGDGVSSCNRSCVCTASGDPHIRTFDSQTIDVNGACRYTLTKSTAYPDPCAFNVEIDNKIMDKYNTSTLTRDVHVHIYGLSLVLGIDYKFYVDGYLRYIPNNIGQGKVKVYKSGRWLVIDTKCGLSVWWNGHSSVVVRVPSSYHDQMTGLCGNCNGVDSDDYYDEDGVDLSSYSSVKRDELLSQSYLVQTDEGSVIKTCPDVLTNHQCIGNIDDSHCELLNIENRDSPFKACTESYPCLARRVLQACKSDVCRCRQDEDRIQKKVCEYMEEFAEECEQRGFHIKFRSSTFCPMKCGNNMNYSTEVSGCPATCTNLKPHKCNLPLAEGCKCLPGFVLSGNDCVEPEMCGCFSQDYLYIPLGETFVTEDCSEVQKCELVNNAPLLKHVAFNQVCHQYAACEVIQGVPKCVCQTGYYGDGYKSCTKD